MELEKTNKDRFYFRIKRDSPDEKKVWLITKKEASKFNELGSTIGDIGISMHMATKYTKNFLDRVYAFTVDSEDIDDLITNKELLDKLELELSAGAKITFYERTENSPRYDK